MQPDKKTSQLFKVQFFNKTPSSSYQQQQQQRRANGKHVVSAGTILYVYSRDYRHGAGGEGGGRREEQRSDGAPPSEEFKFVAEKENKRRDRKLSFLMFTFNLSEVFEVWLCDSFFLFGRQLKKFNKFRVMMCVW